MRKYSLSIGIIFLLFGFLSQSCTQEAKNKSNTSSEKEQVNNTETQEPPIAYKMPSPVELFMFLKSNEIEYKPNSVSPVENITKYYTNASKAINFGIYASDLAYCTVFGMYQETFLYFSTTRTLATDLGFTSGFDELMVERINANLYNNDSLFQITNDSYADACNYLEESGKKDVLALILAGSWIESVHIIIQSIDTFSNESPIVIRLADQRFLLENLVNFFKSIDNNISTDKILDKLFDLQASFDLLYDNADNINMTKAQYDEITEKVEKIRTELIN
ncbi:MAG: hypothetical protein GXO79_07540 [Chlorobi bacterium]|nr:hypothetical protein [Chlorobiota bacterium]